MKLDFQRRQKPRGNDSVYRLPPRLPVILGSVVVGLVIAVFLFTLLPFPQRTGGYVVFAKTGVVLMWVDTQTQTMRLLPLPGTIEIDSREIGAYPLQNVIAANQQMHRSTTEILTDLSAVLRIPLVGLAHGVSSAPVSRVTALRAVSEMCLRDADRSFSIFECLGILRTVLAPAERFQPVSFPTKFLAPGSVSEMSVITHPGYQDWLQIAVMGGAQRFDMIDAAVVNGSQISGVGSNVGSVIADFGFHVLAIKDAPDVFETGVIYVDANTFTSQPQAIALLTALLHMPVKQDDVKTREYRSDIVILIGKQEAKSFDQ